MNRTEINIIIGLKDLEELISVFAIVFDMPGFISPSKMHLQKLLGSDTFFAIVAKREDKIIGGLTVYTLDQYYLEKPLAYIYDLAVLTKYQRQGIGKALITFTNEYCKEKGYAEVFVQADKADDYAIEFYRSTQPSAEESVVHFAYNLDKKKI
ncbi:GNAT family N-acetyltransferase [Niabella ginsengisoli]|uniref:GNAT family N-acetyltransferase n=1 Tax=Niabella ginsengisoli TaxID=522298 RepID=A0ABS9SEG3_9BACT|nr:GNAT family N-acetyltransferase [Niabella ginsengisoli]MCH5596757.1 GNAT family N-acetyltransferase [Niabella ginsengisoli]